ncbi:MAG: hypothetical protein ACOYXN_02870 [Acidobacteriota bacterium]
MDRKDFLKSACSLCACGCVAGLVGGTKVLASEEKPPVDPRLAFTRYQVAKLVGLMAVEANAGACKPILEGMGRECAKLSLANANIKGDPEGYFAAAKEAWGTEFSWDKEKGVITVTGTEKACSCPLVDLRRTPAFFCNCTVGYQKQAFEMIFGGPVEVSLKATQLSGAKRCVFEVRPSAGAAKT